MSLLIARQTDRQIGRGVLLTSIADSLACRSSELSVDVNSLGCVQQGAALTQ